MAIWHTLQLVGKAMRSLRTLLVYLLTLIVVAALAFGVVMILAGPHAGLLPARGEVVVLALGWLSVVVVPILAARRAWRRG
ncbi:MAG: hypothetical protein V4558_06705 [Gemmatimonadota bacterium]